MGEKQDQHVAIRILSAWIKYSYCCISRTAPLITPLDKFLWTEHLHSSVLGTAGMYCTATAFLYFFTFLWFSYLCIERGLILHRAMRVSAGKNTCYKLNSEVKETSIHTVSIIFLNTAQTQNTYGKYMPLKNGRNCQMKDELHGGRILEYSKFILFMFT